MFQTFLFVQKTALFKGASPLLSLQKANFFLSVNNFIARKFPCSIFGKIQFF